MSSLINQKGSVMYVCRNTSQNFLALRFDGAAVIVCNELLKGKEFLADDIIEFDANPIGKAEAALYNTVKPKWKATRIKFLKHAEQWKGTAKVITLDANGEYCFLEGKDPKGVNYNIFCTRISVLPPVDKIGAIFSTGSTVRVICKEQVATMKNNQVKWRTIAATDMKHDLRMKAGSPLNAYEAIALLPAQTQKPAPKPRVTPTGPRPATAAAAVKSTPSNTSVNSSSRGSSPVQPPTDCTSQNILTVAQVVKDSLNEAPSVPPPISPPNSTSSQDVVQDVTFAPPPGLDSPTMSSHPIPSYEWMKSDFIHSLTSVRQPLYL